MSEVESLTDLQNELNRLREQRAAFVEEYGPLPPPSRRLRWKWGMRRRLSDARTGLALRIAPWLGED